MAAASVPVTSSRSRSSRSRATDWSYRRCHSLRPRPTAICKDCLLGSRTCQRKRRQPCGWRVRERRPVIASVDVTYRRFAHRGSRTSHAALRCVTDRAAFLRGRGPVDDGWGGSPRRRPSWCARGSKRYASDGRATGPSSRRYGAHAARRCGDLWRRSASRLRDSSDDGEHRERHREAVVAGGLVDRRHEPLPFAGRELTGLDEVVGEARHGEAPIWCR